MKYITTHDKASLVKLKRLKALQCNSTYSIYISQASKATLVSVTSSVVVSVLRVILGETRHPDPADRRQNHSHQQHSLRDPVQASAG